MINIKGSCHCGNIQFDLAWPADAPQIGVRECGCSFCQKHGGEWTSHREAELDVRIDDDSRVSRYQFGTSTADFHICSTCGVVPFVVSEIDEQSYAVVNVNAFEANSGLSFTHSTTDFDGEDVDSRLDRRRRNWISTVRF
ncbi:MAG: GFA family protein [Woeseiaceae bacterium]